MVVVLLSKERVGVHWPAVTAQEAKQKEKSKAESDPPPGGDANSSIMGLMKKLYDDGDDSMKQVRSDLSIWRDYLHRSLYS